MNTKFVPLISRPCSQPWSQMAGDEKRRFCEQCQLHVHNLSAMTPAERESLLSQRTERQCIAYVASDRSIHVRPGLWLFFQRWLRYWRAGLAFLTLGWAGCASKPPPTTPPTPVAHDCKQIEQISNGKMYVGGAMAPDPGPLRWRRFLKFFRY